MPKVIQENKMKIGECRRTRRGVQYCRTTNGVRFTGKKKGGK